jgi:hypothetical protein
MWRTHSLKDFMADVLLQIAYTLVVFEDFGLMHHDLHSGNIFVEYLETPLHLSLNIGGGRTIVRDVNFFVQIYDFDQSTKVSTGVNAVVLENKLLENKLCYMIGSCNQFHKNVDWFTVLHWIHLHKPGTAIPNIADLVHPDLLENKNLVHIGRPCTKNQAKQCDRINLDDPNIIMSPLTFLQTFYEASTVVKKPAFSRPKPNTVWRKLKNTFRSTIM